MSTIVTKLGVGDRVRILPTMAEVMPNGKVGAGEICTVGVVVVERDAQTQNEDYWLGCDRNVVVKVNGRLVTIRAGGSKIRSHQGVQNAFP